MKRCAPFITAKATDRRTDHEMKSRRPVLPLKPRITPYHIVEKPVLCITAFWPTRLPLRGQKHALPQRNIHGRSTPVSRHTVDPHL